MQCQEAPGRVQIEHVNTLMVAKTLRYLTPVHILHNGRHEGAREGLRTANKVLCNFLVLRTVHLKTRRGATEQMYQYYKH